MFYRKKSLLYNTVLHMDEKISLSVIDAAANGHELTPEQANVLDNVLYIT